MNLVCILLQTRVGTFAKNLPVPRPDVPVPVLEVVLPKDNQCVSDCTTYSYSVLKHHTSRVS